MITVTTCLWDANQTTFDWSRCYDESWVDKLYRGVRRNLRMPFRFVCFVDRPRKFQENIEQEVFSRLPPDYGSCVEAFSLNVPMLFMGLDTVIVGWLDKMATWCLEHPGELALPKHPYEDFSINGFVCFGGGNADIFGKWRGENDMKWTRSWPHHSIDKLWPDRVLSYKAHVAKNRTIPQKAAVVYFHGVPKPNELQHLSIVRDNWK